MDRVVNIYSDSSTLRRLLTDVVVAADRMRDHWAEGDDAVKKSLWTKLHTAAEAAYDEVYPLAPMTDDVRWLCPACGQQFEHDRAIVAYDCVYCGTACHRVEALTGYPGTDGHATWCPVPHPDEHEGTCVEQLIKKCHPEWRDPVGRLGSSECLPVIPDDLRRA